MAGFGLLGNSFNDPRSAANMGLAAGLLRGDFAGGLLASQDGFMQAQQAQKRGLLDEMRMQEAQMKMAQMQREQDFLSNLPDPSFAAGQQGLAGGGGPTLGNAARIPQVSPTANLMFQGVKAGAIPLGDYLKSMQPQERINKLDAKDFDPESVQRFNQTGNYADLKRLDKLHFTDTGGGTQGLNPFTGAPVGPQTAKTGNPFNDLILGDGAGGFRPNVPLIGAKRDIAKAGASNVSVNTGQKGLDNELKIRSDFRSEPIYKAHQEVQSAHSQISSALKLASPAGDLAGATKIMKILDPGSVVRESELGMAMAASGALDRLQYYASNIVNGTKLTPTQRKDFQNLADKLYSESANQYNSKRKEYEGFATDYGLNGQRILGPSITSPKMPPASAAPGGAGTLDIDALVNKYAR